MDALIGIISDAVGLLYKRDLAVFAMSTMLISILIWALDWVGAKLLDKSSLLGVGYGGFRSLQSLLLWGVGAGLAAYIGGLAGLFNSQNINSTLIVGVSWPTVLPRLIAMSSQKEEEEEESNQAEEEEQ
jgi:hypothetical protein